MHEKWVNTPEEEKDKARSEALEFFKKAIFIKAALTDQPTEKIMKDLQDSINAFLFICTQVLDYDFGKKVRMAAGEFILETLESEQSDEANLTYDHFHFWYIGTRKKDEKDKNPIPDDVH